MNCIVNTNNEQIDTKIKTILSLAIDENIL